MNLSECAYLGFVTHVGRDGQIVIRIDSDIEFTSKNLESIFIQMNTSDEILVPFFLNKKLQVKKGDITGHLDQEVHFPEDVFELKGKSVYLRSEVKEEQRSALEDLSFLLSFKAEDEVHGHLGVISDFYTSAAHPILSILDKSSKEILVPFVPELILSIDKKEKLVIMRCPDGLLDVYST